MQRISKKALCALLAVLLLAVAMNAGASALPFSQTLQTLLQAIEGTDTAEDVRCALIALGYLHEDDDDDIESAILCFQQYNGLEETGVLDGKTVLALYTAQADIRQPYRVWIPTMGGKKHHGNADCSGMIDPLNVPKKEALRLGFRACKKCYGK